MKKVIYVLLILSFCFYGNSVKSQITVDNTVTPEEAMETLLGENVTISNLTFIGFNEQIGTFECDDCGLDFTEGVILSSGNVDTALGPNDSGFNTIDGTFQVTPEIDLNQLATLNLHDVCVLEFDFVALGDSVFFDFTWASDEYPEFTTPGSTFNDVFGFFISGPDINGTFSNSAENIALIPNTDLPVTIQNVNNGIDGVGGGNGCVNCEYYVHNGTGNDNSAPQFTDENVIGYDGYTSGLTAVKGGLVCGETYHLKLAIADAGDNSYDSAVILRAGSLSSNLSVGINLTVEATTEDGVMNEECGVAELVFSRPESISSDIPFVVNITYSGTAINGVDFTEIPEQIVFDPGVDVISFTLDAFEDGVTEGLETVIMELESVAVCQGESIPSNFEFGIIESIAPVLEGYDVEICDGTSVVLEPIITGGSGGFLFEWSTTEETDVIEVSPSELTAYTVTLTDTCLTSVNTAEFNVDIAVFPELVVTTTPEEIEIGCNWFGQFLEASASGGDGTYSYTWLDGEGNQLGTGNSYYFSNTTIQGLTAQVTDGCTYQTQLELPITTSIDLLEVEVPTTIDICPGDFTIEADIQGGEGNVNITWYAGFFETIGTNETLEYTTDVSTSVSVNISDECGQFFSQTIQVNVLAPEELIVSAGPDLTADCNDEVTLTAQVVSGVDPLSFEWQTQDGLNLGVNNGAMLTISEDEMVILNVSDACAQVVIDTVFIELVEPPIILEMPELLAGDCLTEFTINAELASLSSDLNAVWTGPEGMQVLSDLSAFYQSGESGILTLDVFSDCAASASASTEIVISSVPVQIFTSADTTICYGDLALLSAFSQGGSGDVNFTWSGNGDVLSGSNVSVDPSVSQLYSVTGIDQCGNSDQNSVNVYVNDIAVTFSSLQLDELMFEFTSELEPECPGCTYLWNFSDGATSTDANPIHEYTEFGYIGAALNVFTEEGCESFYQDVVNVPAIFFIPNSFTPDNDGINDVFEVIIRGIDEYNLVIFNKWGEPVFETSDPNAFWDGSFKGQDHYVPNGVYNYVLEYRSLDSQAFTKKGFVTIIR